MRASKIPPLWRDSRFEDLTLRQTVSWSEKKTTTLGRIPIQTPEERTLLESSLIHDICPTAHCVMPARKRCLTLQFGGIPQVILSGLHCSVLSKDYLLFFSPPDAFIFTIKVYSFCSVLSPVTKHQTYCHTLPFSVE